MTEILLKGRKTLTHPSIHLFSTQTAFADFQGHNDIKQKKMKAMPMDETSDKVIQILLTRRYVVRMILLHVSEIRHSMK